MTITMLLVAAIGCIIAVIFKKTTPAKDQYFVGFVLGSLLQVILQIVR